MRLKALWMEVSKGQAVRTKHIREELDAVTRELQEDVALDEEEVIL
jgi:hypothetical protein